MSENDPVRRIEQLLRENTKKLLEATSYQKRRNSIDVGSLAIQPSKSIPWQYKDRISRLSELSFIPEKRKIDDISNKDSNFIDVEALSDEDTEKTSSLKLMLETVKIESRATNFTKAKSQPCLSSNDPPHNASFSTINTKKRSDYKTSKFQQVQILKRAQSTNCGSKETQLFLQRTNTKEPNLKQHMDIREKFWEKNNSSVYDSLMPRSKPAKILLLEPEQCAILPKTSTSFVAKTCNDDDSAEISMRPFKCLLCNVSFRYNGHLERHYRSNGHVLKCRETKNYS